MAAKRKPPLSTQPWKKTKAAKCPLCKSHVEAEFLARRVADPDVVDWLRAIAEVYSRRERQKSEGQ